MCSLTPAHSVGCSVCYGPIQQHIQCLAMSEMKKEIRKFLKRIAFFFVLLLLLLLLLFTEHWVILQGRCDWTIHSWAILYNAMHFSKYDIVLIHPNRHYYATHILPAIFHRKKKKIEIYITKKQIRIPKCSNIDKLSILHLKEEIFQYF